MSLAYGDNLFTRWDVVSSSEGVQEQLAKEEEKRHAERTGRIRAERQLKACSQLSTETDFPISESMERPDVWAFKPLGELRSVFTQRCLSLPVATLPVSHSFMLGVRIFADV